MKLCQVCGQSVAEEITTCPNCGNQTGEGRKHIDDYRIMEVIHESYSSILCRAYKEDTEEPVMLRIFTSNARVDEKIALRLKQELEELKKLPEDYFVRHHEIKRSSDGLWYRVSEWIDAEKWGTLLASGIFRDYRVAFDVFYRMASILEGLHRIGHIIPHLILDDIMVIKDEQGTLNVKIDYKISRFLDPQMDRPGPMLKKLMNCHPDIINQRPLDIRSDIWSLGKIFVELLSGDPDIYDFSAKVDELPLPDEIGSLIKVMLAEDPDLRPQSMAEVAETLSQVKDKDIRAAKLDHIESAPAHVKEVKGLRKRIRIITIVLAILIIFGGLFWYYLGFERKGSEATLMDFANQYASSVAFVMVDYWLKADEGIFYRNRTEGTAFLVDDEGYLLTNRHVACPWLEDRRLLLVINRLRQNRKSFYLGYRIFLWFEGEKAFNRLPDLSDSSNLEDIYHLESAFSTEGTPRLIISGVARSPVKTWQVVKSPLKDDFAVLKIDAVPEGLEPLSLDLEMDVSEIQKLSPVITIGFPLGSRTQATTINVSVTRGHVRRTFENMFQVDTSLYRGNSGGPIIDVRGKVIGIASGVAMDWVSGPVPVATPLSDIGMVLPITKAVGFLQELKAGQVKWNGVLDLSVDVKLKKITEMARQGRWEEVQALVDEDLKLSFDPALVMAAGVMHFCAGDNTSAKQLFGQAHSMDKENNIIRFMLFIIDWLTDQTHESPHRKALLALDWRSSDEFLGYLVRILEGKIEGKSALRGGYIEGEKSWLHYINGLIRFKQGYFSGSEKLFKEAVLISDIDEWVFFLALAGLEKVQKQIMLTLSNANKRDYQAEIDDFVKKRQKSYMKKRERQTRLAPLFARLSQRSITPQDRRNILKQILEMNYRRGEVIMGLAYYSAMDELWEQAIEYSHSYLDTEGRENAGRLSVGLLEPQIYYIMGQKGKAKVSLEDYCQRIKDPWYRTISECLLSKCTEQSLTEKAGESPENLLTAHTSLGFWAEGSGEKKKAIKHYKEALGSYMDNWIEYEFAKERIKRLRSH